MLSESLALLAIHGLGCAGLAHGMIGDCASGDVRAKELLVAGSHEVCGWETHAESRINHKDLIAITNVGPLPVDECKSLCESSSPCTNIQVLANGDCVWGTRQVPCKGLKSEPGQTSYVALLCNTTEVSSGTTVLSSESTESGPPQPISTTSIPALGSQESPGPSTSQPSSTSPPRHPTLQELVAQISALLLSS